MPSVDPSYGESKVPYRWLMLALCWLIYFSFGLISTTLSAVATPVRADLNLSYSQMGFALGTWQLVYTIVAIPLGFLIDRIGSYKSLLIATVIVSVSGISRAFAVDFWTLDASVGLFGVGGSIVSISLAKVVSLCFTGRERGTAAGIYSTGVTTGAITALALTNSLVIPLVGNWRNAYLVYGLIGLVVAAVWIFLGRKPILMNELQVMSSPVKKHDLRIRETFTKNVLLIVIIGTTGFLVAHGLSQWLPTILEQGGMTPVQAGLAVSFVNVFMIFGSLISTRLPYMVGSKKLAIAILLFLQGISVLTISGVSGSVLWIVLALRGISGGFMPLLSLILMDLPEVGPSKMGMVGGLLFGVGEIGGFGGPALMGAFKDVTGTFTLGLVVLAVICEGMIIASAFLKVDRKQDKIPTATSA